ncbi:MAG TPA: cytochrome C [Noviherbaspirillum sp.]|nr:cytochrome C [Noviherbaspirillum sp.]
MKRLSRWCATVAAAGLAGMGSVAGYGAEVPAPSRGELLYNTHCIACHTTHVHWRDQRLASDWPSLTHQVQRWQSNTHLGWNEQDVVAVATYLNTLYYHFPQPSDRVGLRSGRGE